jgi:hypothetical protein
MSLPFVSSGQRKNRAAGDLLFLSTGYAVRVLRL